jgi:Fe-S cluster biogenesis protein NfuA
MSSDEAPLAQRLERFMQRQFPQIAMHGGNAGVERLDEETGEVWLTLGGACSGCGISPLTVQALETRMVREFDELSVVHASTADAPRGEERPDLSDVPF